MLVSMKNTAQAAKKLAVSARIISRRVDRRLMKGARSGKEERLRMIRTGSVEGHWVHEFVIVDPNVGVVAHDVDLEKLARELDVIKSWETLEGA